MIEDLCYVRPSWMSAKSTWRAGTVWEEARIGGLFLSPPALDREPQRPPLGTHKTKMAARTGKRSILTNLRKNRGL